MKRILKAALIVVPLLLIVAWLMLRSYLHSSGVAAQVTSQLTAAYGGPVALNKVDIGFTGTTLHGLRFFEVGHDPQNAEPWLTVETATIDVTLTDLLRGDTKPGMLNVQGATMLLRFDRAGELATRFPIGTENAPLPWDWFPQVSIKNATVVLRKEQAGELVAKNVVASVDKESGQLKLSGSCGSDFGPLKLQATLDKDMQTVMAQLDTAAPVHVTQALLDRLPFVPRVVFQEIRVLQADATGALSIHYGLKSKEFKYRIDLDAVKAECHIPSAALVAHNASGKIVIEDNLVDLRGIKGQTFGGSASGDGKLDFRGPVWRMNFPDVRLENLDVKNVPQAWGVPAPVQKSIANGKLFGNLKLELTFADAEITPQHAATFVAAATPDLSSGQWLRNATILAAQPHWQVRIDSEGKGEVRDPLGKREPIQFDWRLAPTPLNEATLQKIAGYFQALTTMLVLSHEPAETQEAQPKKAAGQKYFDFTLNLKNVSLAELLKNEDVNLPFPVDGKLSFHVKTSIPVDTIQELRNYKVEGDAQLQDLVVANVHLQELATDFQFVNGTLYLKSLQGKFDNAANPDVNVLSGSGQVQLVPLGDLHADLRLRNLPLEKITGLPAELLRGDISGSFTFDSAADKLAKATDLQIRGKLASERISAYGFNLDKVTTSVTQKDGVLTLPDLQARLEGNLIQSSASLQLNDDRSYLARFALQNVSMTTLHQIAAAKKIDVPAITGALDAETIVKGKLDASAMAISGDIQSKSLKVNELETKDVNVHWQLDKNTLSATRVSATLYDGKATGSAAVPLDGKSPGRADLKVQALNIARLVKDMRMPIAVDGRVDGDVKVTFAPANQKQETKTEFHVNFKAPKLRVQNIPTEQLKGNVKYQQDTIDYNLTGSTLGGTFDLQGQIPRLGKEKQPPVKGKEGHLRIKDARVARLLNALGLNTHDDLKGTINIDVRYTHDPEDRLPRGQGVLRIDNLRWRDAVIAETLQSDVVLADQQMRIRNLEGSIADGTMRGQLVYYFRERERSHFTLNLEGVQMGQLLAPWTEKRVEGSAQLRLRGKLGSVWNGNADFDLARGKILGLDIAQWRLPIAWSYAPDTGRGQFDINETTAQLVHGRANGKMNLTWDGHARVDGSLRIDNVELREFLRQTIGASDLGAGRTTAKVDFKGTEVRSLKDITATIVASFQDTQALQAPVLKQIAPYLGMGPSTTFQKGNLAARLTGGVVRIDKLLLQGNNVQMFVDGSMTLEERLDLHVVAKTGDIGWPTLRLGPIGLRVPIAGPVPLVVLQEASTLLSNHVIYLDVTGTPRSPTIRPRALPMLSEEAVRFFLNRANLPVTLNP